MSPMNPDEARRRAVLLHIIARSEQLNDLQDMAVGAEIGGNGHQHVTALTGNTGRTSGPLAMSLAIAAAPLVLVLAVDMPRMSAELLRALLSKCCGGMGVVPLVEGQPEPLAAVYPRTARPTHRTRGTGLDAPSARPARAG